MGYGNDYSQVERWIVARLRKDVGSLVLFRDLYADYREWVLGGGGNYVHSDRAIGKMLNRAGARRYRKLGVRYVTGFRLAGSVDI